MARPADIAAAHRIGEHAGVSRTPDARSDADHPDPAADSAAPPEAGRDRRSFLRQLSGDAVTTAGKLAGASMVLSRSLVAAGEAAVRHLEQTADVNGRSVGREGAPDLPPTGTSPAAEASLATQVVSSTVSPDPVAALTPEQHAFLTNGTRAALAVNDPGGHPLVAFTTFHWDGSLIRLPARDSTARTIDIDRDPRVSLLIDDPGSDAWVAVAGVASLVYGDQVEPAVRLILAKYHDEADAALRSEEMRKTGDQIAIHVRPTRFIWRSG